jgi:hypothetical protein
VPTSYTSALRLALPATGELSGTWGTTVNNNVTSMVEQAIAGYAAVAMTDANYTLTTANGTTDEARCMYLKITGTLTASRNVVCPTANKLYFVKNATTGGFDIVFKTSGGTGITITSGSTVAVMCDGTNVVSAVDSVTSVTTATNLAGGAAGKIPYQTGSGATSFSGVGTAGQAILSGGTGSPTFTTGTLTLAGNFATSGANALTITTTSATNVTFPPSGTLGTVSTVSVTTANGVSGSVATATTTPAITLTLGAITPTTVNGLTVSTTTGTFTLTNGKTLAVSNTITLAGTDGSTYTFPGATASIGYLNIPQNSQSAAYTTVLADAGKHIFHPVGDANTRTFTIDSNANVAYPVGTTITFVNQASQVVTIAITSDTMTLAGTTTTGSRSLAQNGVATALKITSTAWLISGTGLT